ncbi:PEP-CTERM sorting domain-containing protein [Aestuariispira insulae]|uniref:Putative secreted protein with PEP-CTERM sorting signal n=1 Tax=Aestuariispira insulae TaxID=1461337 RepID=A0A3D9HWI9_9PROT|nr:PEP-CTERM sorting domain-containing protein [Aestuariispira insulae]RED53868.1 putative secreted protein with PEP-CTERM sorting signal [Aestuariispira insulae]
MKKIAQKITLLAGLALGGIALASPAQAALIVDFSIDNPAQTVSTTDTVEFWATLSNDASSTGSLIGNTISAVNIYLGSLVEDADYSWDHGTMWQDIEKIILAPGESYSFLFVTLTPKNGSVAPDVYESPGAWLEFNKIGYGNGWEENKMTLTVTAGTDVPAPATLGLLLIGLAGVAGLRARHRG